MPRLSFHLKKRADAKAPLILIREDGTHTAGTIGVADGYGPVHDLAHYARSPPWKTSSGPSI